MTQNYYSSITTLTGLTLCKVLPKLILIHGKQVSTQGKTTCSNDISGIKFRIA